MISEGSSLLWCVERKVALTNEAPDASLVTVAFAADKYFVVAGGDVPAVVGRSLDPERDIPSSRLIVSLEVGGLPPEQSSGFGAVRETWEALLQWEGVDPAPDARVTLEVEAGSVTTSSDS